jgi:hypothetical protein
MASPMSRKLRGFADLYRVVPLSVTVETGVYLREVG